MRLLLTLLLLASAASAQEVRQLTFACDPQDAQVYLEISGNAPYLLGPCNRPISVDMAMLGSHSVTFRREGWYEQSRDLKAGYFNGRDQFPDPSQGPVRLSPRPDLPSRGRQLLYYAGLYKWLLAGLALLAAGLAWRWRKLRAGHDRAVQLDSMRASGDGPDPLLMKVLGGYRLIERIGSGGMASVYRALPDGDLDERKAVAVKVMHPHVMDEANRRRFKREIEIYGDLSHRHILRLLDYGDQDGLNYLVLELLKGQTLGQKLGRRMLSREEVLSYARPLADAMDYAHGKRIVHRDLKPDNIFLCEDGRLVVMDFGIARGGDYTQATATGEGLGTPHYMAPEQLQGRPEPASDLYSFGVILFEMFSGTLPFQGEDTMAVAYMQVGQQAPDLGQLCPGLPGQVPQVVARLLAKDPRKRFASFREAVEAL